MFLELGNILDNRLLLHARFIRGFSPKTSKKAAFQRPISCHGSLLLPHHLALFDSIKMRCCFRTINKHRFPLLLPVIVKELSLRKVIRSFLENRKTLLNFSNKFAQLGTLFIHAFKIQILAIFHFALISHDQGLGALKFSKAPTASARTQKKFAAPARVRFFFAGAGFTGV